MAERVVHLRLETRDPDCYFRYRSYCHSFFAEKEARYVSPDGALATCRRCKRNALAMVTHRMKS